MYLLQRIYSPESNLLRGLWSGEAWSAHLVDVAVLFGMLLLGILISVKTFRWE